MNFLKLLNKKSLIAAHRGASSKAPENTLLAMQKSVGLCDFIEIDVQLSSDGVAVILHDKTLERTTNVKKLSAYINRSSYKVSDFTYDELTVLDFGEGEKLLSLHSALKFIKEKKLYLNVEIKDVSEDFSAQKIVSTVLKEIKNLGVESQILISSFRAEYLSLLKKISPEIAIAFLEDTHHHDNLVQYLKNLGADAYHINKKLLSQDLIDSLNSAGISVGVYVVNDKQEQKKLFAMGVNTIFTNL